MGARASADAALRTRIAHSGKHPPLLQYWSIINSPSVLSPTSCPQLDVVVSDVNDNAPLCPDLPDIHVDESISAGRLLSVFEVRVQYR